MSDRPRDSSDLTGSKGSIIRLCGVVLIFVGMLDSMLFWKGGMVGHGFFLFLFAAGLVLYAIGSIARRRRDYE